MLQEEFFDSIGARIRYVVAGEGSPVVLVHGILDSVEIAWEKTGVLDALASSHRVIALDLRGHGKSDKPHSPQAYGAALADDVLRVMDRESVERASICGYSLGAMILGKLLELGPNRISAAIFAGLGPVIQGDPVLSDLLDLAFELRDRGTLGAIMRTANTIGHPAPTEDDVKIWSPEILGNNDPLAIAAVAESAVALACCPLVTSSVPKLAVWGSLDPLGVYAQRVDARHVEIEGEDHLSTPFSPEFRSCLVDFLGSIPNGAHWSASASGV